MVLKPANISFEEAAAVPLAAVTALQGLRKGKIGPGQKVLINGASGGVGTFAVQIAKSFGAEVTAVCSTRNLDQARSIGADHVIDYTQEDFTKNGQHYDLILAAGGYHWISDYKRALSPKGIYVMTGGSMAQLFQAMLLGPWMSMTGSKKMGNIMARTNQKDLVFLKELLEAGKIVPVIERRYPLSQVAEAIRYLEEGHAHGKLVVTLEDGKTVTAGLALGEMTSGMGTFAWAVTVILLVISLIELSGGDFASGVGLLVVIRRLVGRPSAAQSKLATKKDNRRQMKSAP